MSNYGEKNLSNYKETKSCSHSGPEVLKISKMANNKITLPKKDEVNGHKVVNKSYVENGPSFVLNLDGQVELVTVSKDLVKYLHDSMPKAEPRPKKTKWTPSLDSIPE